MKRLVIFYVWFFLAVIGTLQLVAPITYSTSPLPGLLMILPSAILWTAAVATARTGPFTLAISHTAYERTQRFLIFLFVVFAVLAYADFFLISQRSLFTILADREAANVTGRSNSVLGGVVALLSASQVVLLALRYVYAFTNGLKNRLFVDIVIAAVGIPPLLFSGGRNPIVVAVLFLVVIKMICMQRLQANRPRLSLKRFLLGSALVAGGVTLVWYILHVSIARRVLQGTLGDYDLVLLTYSVDPTAVYDFIGDRDLGLAVGLSNLYYYVTHGLYRLSEMSGLDWSTTGGFATFPLYIATLNFALGADFLSIFESRVLFRGSYTTFWGSLYQDGHMVGVFFGVFTVFGLLIYLLNLARYTVFQFLLLSFLLLLVWIAPIYSITATGYGGSLLFVCVMAGIAARLRFR